MIGRRVRTKSDVSERARTPADFDDDLDLPGPVRCKSASESCDERHVVQSGLRHEDVGVRPEFLEELRRRHAEFLRHSTLKSLGEGLRDMALDDAFGREGSWLLRAKLPEDGLLFSATEEPFSIRQLTPSPLALKSGTVEEMLKKWGAAVLNTKGCKSETDDTMVGQDNCCLARLAGGWELAGIFDGHGPQGHWPASRVARTLPYLLQCGAGAASLRENDVESALTYAFEAAERELEAESAELNISLQISGCTGVVALHHPDREVVWLASVGDSRAALLDPGQGVLQETSDHKPSRQDEVERILRKGGDVKETRYDDGYVDQRVYVKGAHFPALGVTRSFGDCVVKDVGVSAEPEVVRWSLQGRERLYLLLCSDGVWEFLESAEVAQCVLGALQQGKSPQEALQDLLVEARKAWDDKEEGTYCDDITMVLVPLAAEVKAPDWESLAGPEEKNSIAKALAESSGDTGCLLQ